MKLSKGKICISPKEPVYLAGFAHRKKKADQVRKNIYMRGLLLEGQVLILSLELLFIDEILTDEIKKRLEETYQLRGENIFITSTHSHSGPMVCSQMHEDLGRYNKEYKDCLIKKTLILVGQLVSGGMEVDMAFSNKKCDLAINRRKKLGKEVKMMPNYQGLVDRDLDMIQFINKDNRNIEAIIVSGALHANTTDINEVSGDFPGELSSALEKEIDNSVVIFLQGFTGNMRPRMIIGEEFFRGSYENTKFFASQLRKQCLDLKAEGEKIDFSGMKLASWDESLEIDKNIQDGNTVFAKDYPEVYANWLDLIRDKDLNNWDYRARISGLRLTDKLLLVFVNGELVCDYSVYIKKKYPAWDIVTVGYTDGMVGYLATAEQLEDGGYEADDFLYYFGLAGKFKPSIEKTIKQGLVEVIDKLIKE